MAAITNKSVSFDSESIICEIKFLTLAQLEEATKWLSCNGDILGVGPTLVFASAASLFLYHELEATIYMSGDHPPVSNLEKTLVSSMVMGILALMIHVWVCAMRFLQYYLDSVIKDSPDVLLQFTTAGLFGYKSEIILGPLTKFLRYQQPQIHITICWFLSLCYADYVRKHYCQTFNMPYLEQWQSQLHERVSHGVHNTVARINSFVSQVNTRLRGFTDPETSSQFCQPATPDSTVIPSKALAAYHARSTARYGLLSGSLQETREVPLRSNSPQTRHEKNWSSVRKTDQQLLTTHLKNCIFMFRLLDAHVKSSAIPQVNTTKRNPSHNSSRCSRTQPTKSCSVKDSEVIDC